MTAPNATTDARPRGGKFLTFFLGDEEYGAEILKVQEIIGMQPITRVPRTPPFIRGVINLRGKVIPIVDLRERFDMPPLELAGDAGAQRCIVVERVSEVSAIASDDVEDAPSFGAGVRTEYLLGLAKAPTADGQGRVRLLLDIDRVLAADELAAVAGATE